MSNFNLITVNDREDTPVSHDFTPNAKTPDGVAEWVEREGVPLGDNKITMSTRRTNNGRYKVRVRMVLPVVVDETINGVTVPKIARTSFVDAEFSFDAGSSVQERKNAVGMYANLLAATQTDVMSIVEELKGIY